MWMYLALLLTSLLIQFWGKLIIMHSLHTYTVHIGTLHLICRYTLALVTVHSANVQCIHHSCLLPVYVDCCLPPMALMLPSTKLMDSRCRAAHSAPRGLTLFWPWRLTQAARGVLGVLEIWPSRVELGKLH